MMQRAAWTSLLVFLYKNVVLVWKRETGIVFVAFSVSRRLSNVSHRLLLHRMSWVSTLSSLIPRDAVSYVDKPTSSSFQETLFLSGSRSWAWTRNSLASRSRRDPTGGSLERKSETRSDEVVWSRDVPFRSLRRDGTSSRADDASTNTSLQARRFPKASLWFSSTSCSCFVTIHSPRLSFLLGTKCRDERLIVDKATCKGSRFAWWSRVSDSCSGPCFKKRRTIQGCHGHGFSSHWCYLHKELVYYLHRFVSRLDECFNDCYSLTKRLGSLATISFLLIQRAS